MGFVRLGLAVLLLSGCFLGVAHAQMDDSAQVDESQLPSTDYGAGYKIIIFHQHQEHAPGSGDDQSGQGPITLDKTYPVIASAFTQDAQAYNDYINWTISRWWSDIDGPLNNTVVADSDTDISLDCEPVGLPPPIDVRTPAGAVMLPGVIAMSCGANQYQLGAAHGGGTYWGFNWLLAEHRPIGPLDVFTPNSGWLKALASLVNADRNANDNGASPLSKLDFADSHHWVLRSDGLGLTYSDGDFENCECGGDGTLDVIPWSKLAPYLRKDGIIPRADWSAH